MHKVIKQKDQEMLSLNKRLQSYQKFALNNGKKNKSSFDKTKFFKATLGTLIPLAAMQFAPAELNAQCNTNFGSTFCNPAPINSTFTFTSTTSMGSFLSRKSFIEIWTWPVDVDGDGGTDLFFSFFFRDFDVFRSNGVSTSTYGTITSQMFAWSSGITPAVQSSFGPAVNFPAGSTISNHSVFQNFAPLFFNTLVTQSGVTTLSNTSGSYVPITNGFIGLQSGMQYGYLEVTVTPGQLCIIEGGMQEPGASAVAGSCSSLLPVELASFSASAKNEMIELQWKTLSELNNEGFEIQRSADGRAFQKIGWVEGYGTSVEALTYQFEDRTAVANQIYYYRLKQIDFNGISEFSTVVTAQIDQAGITSVKDIYPNPSSNGILTLPVFHPQGGSLTVQIFNATGQSIQSMETKISFGENKIPLNLEGIATGMYFAKIEIDGKPYYKQFVIE